MNRPQNRPPLEADICIHIFSASAGLIGVCLTVIGILRVLVAARNAETVADDLLAIDAFLFLNSCLTSYWAMRTRSSRRMHVVERWADGIFLLALFLMVINCGIVAYVMNSPKG